jgi:peroxiredoxin
MGLDPRLFIEHPARPVPAVGAAAPDFTLKTVDGATAITRSKYHPDKPLVLVFGSFT